MKRNPETGDIIRIGKGRKDLVVIDASEQVSYDEIRGDAPYYAYVFRTIPYKVGKFADPKQSVWQLDVASMNVAPPIALVDIEFIGKAKIKRSTVVTYEVK